MDVARHRERLVALRDAAIAALDDFDRDAAAGRFQPIVEDDLTVQEADLGAPHRKNSLIRWIEKYKIGQKRGRNLWINPVRLAAATGRARR